MTRSDGNHRAARRPSWRRLSAATLALFLIVLAFLAGRLRAGADPAQQAQAKARAAAVRSSSAATATRSSSSDELRAPSSVDESDDGSLGQTGGGQTSSAPTTHAS